MIIAAIAAILPGSVAGGGFELDYDKTIILDAEELAEGRIAEIYETILPELRKYISEPYVVSDNYNSEQDSYDVTANGQKYHIYGPEDKNDDNEIWGIATFVFFKIVNDQLSNSNVKFYAINGGNDLFGIFLSPDDALAARPSLNRRYWPYLPVNEAPWYGQFH
jgi:hypothetical protein